MRNLRTALMTAIALAAAGCGGTSSPPNPCKAPTTSCSGKCVNLTSDVANCGGCGKACAAGMICSNGACMMNTCPNGQVPCGANNTCADTTTDSNNCGACGTVCPAGQTCQGSACMAGCGAAPMMMCNGNCVDTSSDASNCGGCGTTCMNGQTCTNSACSGGGANTGDPCTKPSDCGGTKPACITKDAMGTVWPGGYCTSTCNPQKNDPNDTTNTQCPGGAATCQGQGTQGGCALLCTDAKGGMPCTRQGYSCFQACEPTTLSQCDPTKAGVCGQGKTCVRLGADNVGDCVPSCDIFTQMCPADTMGNPQACYASFDTGEGLCSAPYGNPPGADGDACQYLNACSQGLTCWQPNNMTAPVCRPFCGGKNNVACMNGKKCVDLGMTVKVAVAGACGG